MAAVDERQFGAGDFVKLSVQGSFFALTNDFVLSRDWLISKIVTSEIPWKATADGQIFLDVDLTSFRFIVNTMKGIVSLEVDSVKLSTSDLVILKATARYLLLEDMVEVLDTISSGFEKQLAEEEERYRALTTLRIQDNANRDSVIIGLRETERRYNEIMAKVSGGRFRSLRCRAYRTHRPYNECGSMTLITGNIDLTNLTTIKCTSCDNDSSQLKWGSQFECRKVSEGEFAGLIRTC